METDIPPKFMNWAENYFGDKVDLIDVEAEYDREISPEENITLFKNKFPLPQPEKFTAATAREYEAKSRKESASQGYEIRKWVGKTIKESKVYIVVGARGCLPKGTLIKTPDGKIPIEKVKNVLSYNLNKNIVETKKVKVFNSGLKQVIRLHTKKGIIECSPEHKWIIVRNREIVTILTKDLRITDLLLEIVATSIKKGGIQ